MDLNDSIFYLLLLLFFEKGLPCFLLKAYKIGLNNNPIQIHAGDASLQEELKLRKLQQKTTPPRKSKNYIRSSAGRLVLISL
jgi:hypothetical protein